MNWFSTRLRKVHMDFHNSPYLKDILKNFDAEEFVRTLVKAHINAGVFFAKDSFGYAYYDTKIGSRHPGAATSIDFLKEICKEAHKNDIKAIAYYSVAWDILAVEERPDWEVQQFDGTPYSAGGFKWCCISSGYSNYVLDMLVEIAENYEIDGLWLDWAEEDPPWVHCFCPRCHKLFFDRYGEKMQSYETAPPKLRLKMIEFRDSLKNNFYTRIIDRIHKINPHLLISYNNSGSIAHPYPELIEKVGFLTNECHAPLYISQSLKAKFSFSQKKESEIVTSRFTDGWGSWNLKENVTLKAEIATIVSNGCVPSIGDQTYPNGTLEKEAYRVIGEVYQELEQKEPWLKGFNKVENIAILNSFSSTKTAEVVGLDFHKGYFRYYNYGVWGFHKALLEGHQQFDIISEENLEQLDEYCVLIIPDQICLSENTVDKIRSFVKKGGSLIVTGASSLYNFEGNQLPTFGLSDILGVSGTREIDLSCKYFFIDLLDDEISSGCPHMPILIKAIPLGIIPRNEVSTLAKIRYPFKNIKERYAPPGKRTNLPCIIENRFGKGRVIYIGFAIGKDYWRRNDPWLRNIILNTVDRVNPFKVIKVKAPMGVEVNLTRKGKTDVVHIVNVIPQKTETERAFIQDAISVRNVEVKIRRKEKVRRVCLVPEGVELNWKREGEWVTFVVPEVCIHALVEVVESSN